MPDKIIHTVTQNGYFCQYYCEDKLLHGVGGFSAESHEHAELKMWEIIRECQKRMLSTAPSIIKYTPGDPAFLLIEPKLPPATAEKDK